MKVSTLFITLTLGATAALAAPANVLCGGYWWGGPAECGDGYECYYVNPWFSVCVPDSAWSITSITRIDETTTTTIGVTRTTASSDSSVTRITDSSTDTVSRTVVGSTSTIPRTTATPSSSTPTTTSVPTTSSVSYSTVTPLSTVTVVTPPAYPSSSSTPTSRPSVTPTSADDRDGATTDSVLTIAL